MRFLFPPTLISGVKNVRSWAGIHSSLRQRSAHQLNASRAFGLANEQRLQAHHHNNASKRPVTGQTEINSTQDDPASRGRSGFDAGRTTMPSKIILVLTLAIMAISAVPASAKASPAQYAQCAWAQCY
jgi:hypothetical protein